MVERRTEAEHLLVVREDMGTPDDQCKASHARRRSGHDTCDIAAVGDGWEEHQCANCGDKHLAVWKGLP